ncbi:MAG TPA: nicotinamide-nucleotide amidohydrolase family protein [Rhizomicrobium sp.]|jgi:nicotinamide-nucleotide amidase|nr:nicotinamide-nucleotide amidohydrolase family protein [Rhizomicrobium sp.]
MTNGPAATRDCIDRDLVAHAQRALARVKSCGGTVVTAESCTAGLIAAVLSQAEGAGEVLHGSFVTYTKANKTMALGVDARLLKHAGSVNADVARQLAYGALDRSPAELALAVTGVLGPEPDEDGNPVGLVYFACCRRGEEPKIERHDYGEKPHDVLLRATVEDALALLGRCA